MIIANLVVFVLGLILLSLVFKQTQKLGLTVFVGLLLGLASGALLQGFYDKPAIDGTLD